jgi:hypothetical protein
MDKFLPWVVGGAILVFVGLALFAVYWEEKRKNKRLR